MADAGLCQVGCAVEAATRAVVILKISFRINDAAFNIAVYFNMILISFNFEVNRKNAAIQGRITQRFSPAAHRKNRNTGTGPGQPQRGLLACS